MQSADQADHPGLIHHDIREGGHLFIICQRFDVNLCLSKPFQPGIVQLTVDFDLVRVLRIQTDGLRHIDSLWHASPRTSPRIRNRK